MSPPSPDTPTAPRSTRRSGHVSDRLEIGAVAHVSVDEGDPRGGEPRQVELRPAPVEVVERDDLPAGTAPAQLHGQVAADEACAAGNEHTHVRNLTSGRA